MAEVQKAAMEVPTDSKRAGPLVKEQLRLPLATE